MKRFWVGLLLTAFAVFVRPFGELPIYLEFAYVVLFATGLYFMITANSPGHGNDKI
jgi:hypothetical protein